VETGRMKSIAACVMAEVDDFGVVSVKKLEVIGRK
jgi:hypothetical protein